MRRIRVAVVDDHAVVRMGLKYALALFGDLEFAGEHPDGDGAREFVLRLKPDVTLLDIRMPGKDGVTALAEILEAQPQAKVVMLTTSGTEEDVYRSLRLGAKGYVMKDCDPKNIVEAIRAVAAGGRFVPDDIQAIFEARRLQPELTPRETEVLSLLARGLSNREIAAELGVSEDGAKIHLKHAYEKLGAKDRVGAAAIAVRRGIVTPPA